MDRNTVEKLIQSHFDRSITPDERQRLERLLLDEPEACQQFWEEARWNLLIHTVVESKGEAVAESEVLVGKSVLQIPPTFSQPTGSLFRMLTHSIPRALHPRHHTAGFAATVTILTGTFWAVLFLLVWNRERTDFPAEGAQHVATITQAKDAAWDTEKEGNYRGKRLTAGHRLSLKKGMVHIEFRDGARVVIEGPAVLRVDAPGAMTLDRGRLLAYVPERAIGFTVKTSLIDIVDLGTEFGVEVREENTEVQVFQGKVQVRGPNDIRDSARVMVAGKATVFGISPQQVFYAKEKKMNRALYLSLAAVLVASPVQAVLVPLQNPTATVEQSGLPITNTLADNTSGWGTSSNPSIGVYEVVTTITSSNNIFTFTLKSQSGIDNHVLGKFRLSVTTDTQPLTAGLGSWTVLTPTSASAINSNPVTVLSGNVLEATDVDANLDTITVSSALTGLSGITGFRLEAIQDSGIGNYPGPGIPGNNNFVLSYFAVDVEEIIVPVPEPATGALLGLGGMMVVGFARKRRRLRARK